MHPAIILIPVAATLFGPRLWVRRVMKAHDREDEDRFDSAADSARRWLDGHRLQLVDVEITDLGDHYDPQTRTVRLNRQRFDRKSLTAVTAAAHEVSHALQDAEDYSPFVWRKRLTVMARAGGQIGTVILLSVPAAALLARRPVPPVLVCATLLVMLGGGMALQIATLRTELDASFNRALPLLRNAAVKHARLNGNQLRDARQILIACSLTYVASSMLSVLNLWPWLNGMVAFTGHTRSVRSEGHPSHDGQQIGARQRKIKRADQKIVCKGPAARGTAHRLIRGVGKPLVRVWFRLTRQLN